MQPFFLKCTTDCTIVRGGPPAQFKAGIFYEVDAENAQHVRVGKGGTSIAVTHDEVAQYFERHEGSFVEHVASREIFFNAAIFFLTSIHTQSRCLDRAGTSAALIARFQLEFANMFARQRSAQPDTKLDHWCLDLIDEGQFNFRLADVFKEVGLDIDAFKDKLKGLSVSINFVNDRSFEWSETVKKERTFVL